MAKKLKLPIEPMEAQLTDEIPTGEEWQYEPKWDGFRCIAVRDGKKVTLQSKAGQPLARYFPEIVEALASLRPQQFALDGELVVREGKGLSFDALLQRVHPAKSRVLKLSTETPAVYIVFDMLMDDRGRVLLSARYASVARRWIPSRKRTSSNSRGFGCRPVPPISMWHAAGSVQVAKNR